MTPQPDATLCSLAAGVEVHPMDAAGGPKFLLRAGGRQFQVTAGVAQIVEALRERDATVAALAEGLKARGFAEASPERLEGLVRSLARKGVLRVAGEEGAPAEPPAARPMSSYVWLRLPLLGPAQLRPLTGALRWLFRAPVFAALLALTLLAHAYFYLFVFPPFPWAFASLPAWAYLALFGATTLTSAFHELGHASACRHYDCPHGPVGWGVYMYMLVFYTDVSASWRLTRRQRAVVDVGGMYFEAVASLAVLAWYLASPRPLLVYVFVLLDLSIVGSLNPIWRRDGYWLLADLSGRTDLRDASMGVLRGWLARARGAAAAAGPLAATAPRMRAFLAAYSVLSVAVSGALFAAVGWQLAREVAPGLPGLFAAARASLGAAPFEPLAFGEAAFRLLLHVTFAALVLVSGVRFLRFVARSLRPRLGGAARVERGVTS